MKAILFSQDLMFSGRIAAAANAADADFQDVMNDQALVEAASLGCDLIILDLATSAVVACLKELVPTLKALDQPPSIVAYGPHVQQSHLELASELGCDRVMTRGQFNSSLDELFTK